MDFRTTIDPPMPLETFCRTKFHFDACRKCFRRKIGTFDTVENASGRKSGLSTPSKMLPEENWDFRRRRKCFRKKIGTFDAVENASGEKLELSTPSKMLPEKNWDFRRRRRKDISKKLLEKLPCFDRGAGEATAETEGFIHTKRKPPLTPAGSSPKGRGAFQLLSDYIFLFMIHPYNPYLHR